MGFIGPYDGGAGRLTLNTSLCVRAPGAPLSRAFEERRPETPGVSSQPAALRLASQDEFSTMSADIKRTFTCSWPVKRFARG